jgi:long-chain acyl-CoA synthetase
LNLEKTRPWMDKYPQSTDLSVVIPEIGLYDLLENTTGKYGGKTAIICKKEDITYQQLKEQVDRLAAAWHQLGTSKGERIGLMVANHPSYVVAYYAAQKLGLIVVQINPQYTPRELLEIFNDAEITYLVVENENADKVIMLEDRYTFTHIFLTDRRAGDCKKKNILSLIDCIQYALPGGDSALISPKEDIAVIQYTGGTTGKKKGAMLTHYNLVANVVQSKALYGDKMIVGEEMLLTALPLYHVYGMTVSMNLGIYIGATNIIIPKFEMVSVLENIKKYKPTFFPGVPKMYNAFIHYPNIEAYGLNCFKICTSGSAPLPVEIINQFETLTGAMIGEGFGMSESSPSTHRNPPHGIRKIGSIGIPLPQTDSRVVDDHGAELPPNSVGELIIKGPQVMLGYWKKQEETKQALRDGWLYTGDMAIMDSDGYFFIVGRKKEMIIVGGFNIYPQEVEGILYEHPDVKEAAVVGIPHTEIGETVKAYVVPKDGTEIDLEELKGHCYRQLTRYKVPKEFEIMKELPRNSVGKLLKRLLIKQEVEKTALNKSEV